MLGELELQKCVFKFLYYQLAKVIITFIWNPCGLLPLLSLMIHKGLVYFFTQGYSLLCFIFNLLKRVFLWTSLP